ncbi:DUF2306 domain-containing protein [Promicromonospora panici]|uniref:DUF2306 domain-containing protein n=1 Tax=Promicromonospora panici TaxID=2219658 RepID=UPI003BF4AD88
MVSTYTSMAYVGIASGVAALHRIWMIRNYALTFAAVRLRVSLLTGTALMPSFPKLEFEAVYDASGWASIVVNVMVAEYFTVQRTLAPLARRRQRRPAAAMTDPSSWTHPDQPLTRTLAPTPEGHGRPTAPARPARRPPGSRWRGGP